MRKLIEPDAASPLLWRAADAVSRDALLRCAAVLAAELPAAGCAINLAGQRGAFLAGFVAALGRGQVNLLPPSKAAGVVRDLRSTYPDSYVLTDRPLAALDVPQHVFALDDLLARSGAAAPAALPAGDPLAAVTFTSGSTGAMRANHKRWRSLERGAWLAAQRFGLDQEVGLVATVPPQHMYGLETSILNPLVVGCGIHDARPLFPQSVADALRRIAAPRRVLITTPIHLRSFVEADLDWPEIAFVISATAPLLRPLAAAAERLFQAPVLEIYGCSEAGSLASRRTVQDDLWTFYDGVRFVRDGTVPVVSGGHLDDEVPIADVLDADAQGRFRIIGRHADHVSIAGKRASLGDLNLRLNAIEGVEDGVFVAPEGRDGARAERLAALYVSATLDEAALLERLAVEIDPVFMPRPLRRVAQLPRNELGKLPRAALLALIEAPARRRRRRASPPDAAVA